MPFVTETLWKDADRRRVAGHRRLADSPPGSTLDPVAAQRITDMQKLVTEIRRFRSDQGLADRQKVPARLSGIDAADLTPSWAPSASLAWLTEPADDFTPSASLEVGSAAARRRRTGHVGHRRRRRRAPPAGKGLGRRAEGIGRTTAKLGNEDFLAKAPEAVVDKIRDRQRLAREEVDRITARLAGLK